MELRVLRYFLMVAREENITRAAEKLHITQPTLSRQLMQLEESLGASLFRRNNHRITLTEDGMLLKRRAQELLELAEKTRREFQSREELTGEIAIGCGETCNMAYLSDWMMAPGACRGRSDHFRGDHHDHRGVYRDHDRPDLIYQPLQGRTGHAGGVRG